MRTWLLLALPLVAGGAMAGCGSSPASTPGHRAEAPAGPVRLAVKVTSVTPALEPYDPQLAHQGIAAELVHFAVRTDATNFTCSIAVLRAGRVVGSSTAGMGVAAGALRWVEESVPVEGLRGGTFAATVTDARVRCTKG